VGEIAVETDTNYVKIGDGANSFSGISYAGFNVEGKGPTGSTGAQGEIGYTGIQGITGYAGAQGLTGAEGETGWTGAQGETGDQGAQGNTGAQGFTGWTGAQGDTGTQGVQAATGAQGLTGWGGLRGSTGTRGLQGDTGAQGVTGATGAQGATGATGAQGFTGAQGSTGWTGAQGTTGAQGAQGSTGAQGFTGWIGSQGDTGDQGVTGDTGAQGYTGTAGAQGETGTQGVQGYTGAQGATGWIGAQGFTGTQGVQGDTGAQGATGWTGAEGFTGEQGVQGATGAQGFTGHTGAQGFTGAQGAQGDTGAEGFTGHTGAQGSTGWTGAQGFTGIQGAQGYTGSQGSTGAQGAQGDTGAQGYTGYTGTQGSTGWTGAQGKNLSLVVAVGPVGSQGTVILATSYYDPLFVASNAGITVPNIYLSTFTTNTLAVTTCPIQIVSGKNINITNSNSGFTYVLTQTPVYFNPTSITPGYFNYIKPGISNIFPINLTGLSVFSNIQVWLDGADPYGSGVTPLSGTVISSWIDKSGNGYNGTSSGSPTYSSNGIVFSGTENYTIPYSSTHSNETAFFVINYTNGLAKQRFLYGSQGGIDYFIEANNTVILIGGVQTTSNGYSGSNKNIIQEYIQSYTGGSATTTLTNIIDGVTYQSNGSAACTLISDTSITIGNGSNTNFLTGTIAEVIIYNTALTTTQIQNVEGYLAKKWNLTLPGTHPYAFATGLQLWLDAADPYASGYAPLTGTLTTWYDKSGNGNNGTAFGSPTYSNNKVLTSNTNYFTSLYTSTATPETSFIVCSVASISTVAYYLLNGSGNARTVYLSNARLNEGYSNTNIIAGSTGVITANTNILIECTISSTGTYMYYNGNFYQSNVATFPSYSNASLIIGGGSPTTTTGSISEVLIYNSVLSTSNRQAIEGYLAQKWGLTLPGSHPYYTATAPIPVKSSLASNINVGYEYLNSNTNPGTSTLYYNGTSWSLN